MSVFEGSLNAKPYHFAIVVSRYNESITRRLLKGALECLKKHGASQKTIDIVYCPGAFEIPFVAHQVAATEKYDAVICLGCVVRGETPHFEYISQVVSMGINRSAIKTHVPMTFGVLTTNTIEQALERAGGKSGNKGKEAALAAIELADISKKISKRKKKK